MNNGASARVPERYANLGAETWFEGRTQIERQQVILPSDRELIAQLTSRRGWPDSEGRLQLESKQDTRSRNLASPDRADSVLGAMLQTHSQSYAEIVPVRSRSRFNDGLDWQGREAWYSL